MTKQKRNVKQLNERVEKLRRNTARTNEQIDAVNDLAWEFRHADNKITAELGEKALRAADKNNYLRGRAYSLRNLGSYQLTSDQYKQAEQTLEASRSLFANLHDYAAQASVTIILGLTKEKLGDHKTALETSLTVLDLHEKHEVGETVAAVLCNLGSVNFRSGCYDLAIEYYYQSLQIARQNRAFIVQAAVLSNLSEVLWRVGNVEQAIESAEDGLDLSQKHNGPRYESGAFVNLGIAQRNHGDLHQALQNLLRGLELSRTSSNFEVEAEAHINVGEAYLECNNVNDTFVHLQKALQISQNIGSLFYESESLLRLGLAYSRLGDARQSAEKLEQALEIGEQLNLKEIRYKAHLALSELHERQNNTAAALYHHRAFFRHWQDIYGTHALQRIGRMFVEQLSETAKYRQTLIKKQKTPRRRSLDGSALAPRKLRQIADYINSNLEQSISVMNLAGIVGFNHDYFTRSFKQTTGKTPHRFLLEQRIERAKLLLKTTILPISEIAVRCGFSDQSHLTTQFRLLTGFTPRRFRQFR